MPVPVKLSASDITATSVRLNWEVTPLIVLIRALFGASEQGAIYIPKPIVLGSQALFQDYADTVPVAADGDPVGRMLDQSGNGNQAIQSISGRRMGYSEPNGLLQDQVNDLITINGLNLKAASGEKIWTLCVGYSDLGTEDIILLNNASLGEPWIGIGQSGSTSPGISSNSARQESVWFDGVLESPATRGDMWTLMNASSVIVIEFTVLADSSTWNGLSIGQYLNSPIYGPKKSEFWMLREGSLTDLERQDVEAYAAEQAGTTL